MVDYNGYTYATYDDLCYFKQLTAAVPVDRCLLCGSYSRTDVIGMGDNKLSLEVYSVRLDVTLRELVFNISYLLCNRVLIRVLWKQYPGYTRYA